MKYFVKIIIYPRVMDYFFLITNGVEAGFKPSSIILLNTKFTFIVGKKSLN